MDTKRLVIFIIVGMAVVFGWQMLLEYLTVKYNWKRPGQTTSAISTTAPSTAGSSTTQTASGGEAVVSGATAPSTSTSAVANAAPTSAGPQTTSGALRVMTTAQSTQVQLGSTAQGDPVYRLALNLSGQGASIESVVLNQFYKSVDRKQGPYVYQEPMTIDGKTIRAMQTQSLSIDGQKIELGAVPWAVDGTPNAAAATFYVEIGDGATPLVRISKTYRLSTQADPSGGYEVQVRQEIRNLSGRALVTGASLSGTVLPIQELEMYDDRQVFGAYRSEGQMKIEAHALGAFTADKPTMELLKPGGGAALVWIGGSSVYFNAIVRADASADDAPGATTAAGEAGVTTRGAAPAATRPVALAPMSKWFSGVQARLLNPSAKPDQHRVSLDLQGQEASVSAGGTQSIPLRVFFGPKMRSLLGENTYYTALGYDQTLSTLNSGCSNICSFAWLNWLLVKLLEGFHYVLRDWGLAIIALVVLVRLLLHPVTKASTVSMQRMAKMGPEMERLKKKYGDNKEELSKAMMEFYKEQGIGPYLGCLPMFLQMPIWIALWTALQQTFELRQAPFLYGAFGPWMRDLSRPDELFRFAHAVPLFLFGWELRSINLLPVVLAVVFWLQQKVQPKPAATTPEQAQQQKIMQWMTLLFPVLLYSQPSGLLLYILTSTTIGIFESKRIRDHIQAKEEAEKAGRVIVDARPTRGARRKGDGAEAKPRAGLAGWLAGLQAKAEEMRRPGEKRRDRP